MEMESKSPVKTKKPKSFKFLHKKDKDEKDREEKKEEKRKGKEEKKKEKEEKLRAKEEKKRIKKDKKKHVEVYVEDSACVVFGVPLSVAVERSPTHDGVRLPMLVRQCIDYIEEHGVQCEGIYRLSGVKSKVQQLRRAYNSAAPITLSGQDPHVVASLLKQFLRELPEPVLTTDMTAHFEDASQIPGWRDRAEAIRQLLHRLPTPNSTLVHYILAHMGHIIEREVDTKMNFQNVCIVLSPTMRISHRVLNVFFQNHHYLFGDVQIKPYVAPVCSSSAVERVVGLGTLQHEVTRQEAVLAHLHRLLATTPHNTTVQERLWEAQRILTLLKRKVKLCQREESEPRGAGEDLSSEESQRESASDATNTSNNSTSIVTTASESLLCPVSSHNYSGETEQHCVPERQPKASTAQEIPKLPKPMSGRGERAKLQHHHAIDLPTGEKTGPVCTGMTEGDHVTVINIGEEDAVGGVVNTQSSPPVNDGQNVSDQRSSVDVVTVPATELAPVVTERNPTYNADLPSNNNMASTSAPVTIETLAGLSTDGYSGFGTSDQHIQTVCVDAELVQLAREEAQQLAQHAELLAMNHDLNRKLHAERTEIARLREEILELQTLYGYRTYSYDSSESGGESESGGAAGESDSEEELLQQLLRLQQHNDVLQRNNSALVQRIQEQREAVVLLKARLRQTQVQATNLLAPVPASITAAH